MALQYDLRESPIVRKEVKSLSRDRPSILGYFIRILVAFGFVLGLWYGYYLIGRKDTCETICTKVEYTCTGELRTSVYAEIRNGTAETKNVTVIENNGVDTANNTYPIEPQKGYSLRKDVQIEFPYAFRFEVDGKVVVSEQIKPGDKCAPGDTHKK